MLNSNFDLRTFLTESKASTEQIQEATLTEATVMEYIRERMSSMNNEVRSCMKEYLERCNEIDMEHEDAHAQLMNALEDFYNKLKAHFEEDAAAEDPMPGDEEPPTVLPSDAPSRELDGSPMIEGEEEALYRIQTTTPNSEPTIQKLSKRGAADLEKSMDIVSIELVKEEDEDDSFGGEKDEPKELSPFEKRLAKLAASEEEKRKNNPGYAAASKSSLEEDVTFGGEKDELDEAKVKVSIPGQDSFEAEEGKEYSEEEADEYIKNAKDSGATPMNTEFEKVSEEVLSEGLDPETVNLLLGLAKTAVSVGTVPAALGILYQYKDNPKIAKAIAAFERHLDK